VRAADRRAAGLGHAEVPHLARGDQILHRAGHVLDRHGGVDAVLVKKVDRLRSQSLQHPLDSLLHVLRPAVQAASLLGDGIDLETELRRDDDITSDRQERLADDSLR
jgi:hypothetical protein